MTRELEDPKIMTFRALDPHAFKNFKITLERGQFFTSQWAPSVIATLHPAYVLRLMGDPHQTGYKALVEDIAKAWSKANEEIPVPRGEDQLSLF